MLSLQIIFLNSNTFSESRRGEQKIIMSVSQMSGVLNNSQVESISNSCTLEEIEDELSLVPMVKKKQGKLDRVILDK